MDRTSHKISLKMIHKEVRLSCFAFDRTKCESSARKNLAGFLLNELLEVLDLYEVQVVSWYDNENSYTSQMVRTIKYFEKFVK